MKQIKSLLNSYDSKKDEIEKRLKDFKEMLYKSDKKIFAELCFCICTPKSRAELCDRVISKLEKNNLLFTGGEEKIRPFLNLVRFP